MYEVINFFTASFQGWPMSYLFGLQHSLAPFFPYIFYTLFRTQLFDFVVALIWTFFSLLSVTHIVYSLFVHYLLIFILVHSYGSLRNFIYGVCIQLSSFFSLIINITFPYSKKKMHPSSYKT